MLGGYGGGQGGLGGLSDPSAQFKAVYRCYPVVMAGANGNKAELEAGNKIILPSSALDTLARLRVTYPMMFKITNKRTVSGQGRELSTHCQWGTATHANEPGPTANLRASRCVRVSSLRCSVWFVRFACLFVQAA